MQDIDGQLAPFPQLAAHILTWNTHQVHLLLCSLELNQYEPQLLGVSFCLVYTWLSRQHILMTCIRLENDITGEVLIHMDHEALRDIGVHSVVGCLSSTYTYAYILLLMESL